jgi:hypothetical protein
MRPATIRGTVCSSLESATKTNCFLLLSRSAPTVSGYRAAGAGPNAPEIAVLIFNFFRDRALARISLRGEEEHQP